MSDTEGLLGNVSNTRHDPFKLKFDTQFQEVDEEYDSVRKIQKLCYHHTRKGCFNVFSILFGIILAFIWGIVMGTTQFVMIWLVLPWVKIWKLYWTPAVAVAGALLNALFGPCLKNISRQGATINVNGNDIEKMKKRNNNNAHEDTLYSQI
eukprot:432978_1